MYIHIYIYIYIYIHTCTQQKGARGFPSGGSPDLEVEVRARLSAVGGGRGSLGISQLHADHVTCSIWSFAFFQVTFGAVGGCLIDYLISVALRRTAAQRAGLPGARGGDRGQRRVTHGRDPATKTTTTHNNNESTEHAIT